MSTPTTNPVAWHEASSYAAAVRAHLDDLAPEVVEELAGGLEADLLDQAEESSDPLTGRLGDPAAYAAELRAAAGVPPRTAPPRTRTSFREALDELTGTLRAQPWWPQAVRVAHELRPAWWVLRAWVAFQLVQGAMAGLGSILPRTVGLWVLLLLLVAGSYALGRGLWARFAATRPLVLVGDVLAVLLLLPAVGLAQEPSYGGPAAGYVEDSASAATGLVADGRTVTNVFPYGPDGEPLSGVTLLDQDGEPITVGADQLPGEPDGSGDLLRVQVPNWTADGDVAWNVFPMGTALVDSEDFYSGYYEGDGTPGSGLRPPYRGYDEAEVPRPRVPDVLVDPSRRLSSQPSPGPSATPSTPTPSGSVTTRATPQPTPTP
ncbi:hypothetical protein GCM10028777_26660 [Angustibacter speluncae]